MATKERREVHTSSSMVRTMSPTRPMSPQGELDSNLDSILEDLQNSVGRPSRSAMNGHSNYTNQGSPLGGGSTYTTREVQYLTSANPTTVPAERAHSPNVQYNDGQNLLYKTTSYEYNTSSSGYQGSQPGAVRETRVQHNYNPLDSLLDDLQQAKDNTLERGTNSAKAVTNVGIDPGLLEPNHSGNTRVIKTTKKKKKKKTAASL